MKKRRALFFILILILAGALTLLKVPLASSQGPTLVATLIEGEALPLQDPASALWQKATAVDVPLSAQAVTRPMNPQTRVQSIRAQALHDGTKIAFLVTWADETQNDQTTRVQDFRDGVALEFPLVATQPYFCMGMQGGNVNIWHWKADWQADLTAWQDMQTAYPDMNVDQYAFTAGGTPGPEDYQDPNYLPALASDNLFAEPRVSSVEELAASGFGTLTAQAAGGQNVQGYGTWSNGSWTVIFSRDLASAEAEDASFAPGQVYSIAFAAWDGANNERNGEKSTSQWIGLQLQQKAAAPAAQEPAQPAKVFGIPQQYVIVGMFGILFLLILIGAIIYIRLPE